MTLSPSCGSTRRPAVDQLRVADPALSLRAGHPSPGTPENAPAPQILFLALIAGLILAAVTSCWSIFSSSWPRDLFNRRRGSLPGLPCCRRCWPVRFLGGARDPPPAVIAERRRPFEEDCGEPSPATGTEKREPHAGEAETAARPSCSSSPGGRKEAPPVRSTWLAPWSPAARGATVVELNLRRASNGGDVGHRPCARRDLLDGRRAKAETAVKRRRPVRVDSGCWPAPPVANASLLEDVTARSTEIVDRVRRVGNWV